MRTTKRRVDTELHAERTAFLQRLQSKGPVLKSELPPKTLEVAMRMLWDGLVSLDGDYVHATPQGAVVLDENTVQLRRLALVDALKRGAVDLLFGEEGVRLFGKDAEVVLRSESEVQHAESIGAIDGFVVHGVVDEQVMRYCIHIVDTPMQPAQLGEDPEDEEAVLPRRPRG